jgi:hypothetical protein
LVPELVAPGNNGNNGNTRRSLGFARVRQPDRKSLQTGRVRTGANGREPSPALAMQKVEGSSPFIRSQSPCVPDGLLAGAALLERIQVAAEAAIEGER